MEPFVISARTPLPRLEAPRGATARALAEELLHAVLAATRATHGAVCLGDPPEVLARTDDATWDLPEAVLASETRDALHVRGAAPHPRRVVLPLWAGSGAIGVVQIAPDLAPHTDLPALVALLDRFASALERARLIAWAEREQQGRARAEATLRERTSSLIKHQQVGRMGDFRFNTRTRQSFASLECYKLFGLDPALEVVEFETWAGTIIPEDRQRTIDELAACVRDGRPMNLEYRVMLDGQIRRLQCRGEIDREHAGDLFYFGVLSDVTERREIEATLRRQQSELERALRYASVGELAGSIIHEVNQPLTAIVASAAASLRWLDRTPPELGEVKEAMGNVARDVERAVAVLNGLRSLARGTVLRRAEVEMNELVRDVLAMARPDIDRARIRTQMDLEELPRVSGDLTQIQQAVFNVVRNAIDATKDVVDRERVLTVSSRASEEEIVVAIGDVGPPVAPELLRRLFTPFFTTKVDGLGFGLSITRKIVAAHGGRIWATANPEHGLTVRIALPIVASGEHPVIPDADVPTKAGW